MGVPRIKEKPTTIVVGFSLFARVKGFEPSTFRVHCIHYFHSGVDYIFTMSQRYDW